jgi:hypothetical protein
VRRNSNGTNNPRASLFLKEIRILGISIVLPMADTGRSVFTLLFKIKVQLRGWTTSSFTSLIIIKTCLGHLKKETSQWMSPEQMTYPQFLLRKIIFL